MNNSRIPPPPQKIFEYLNGNIVGHYIMKKSVAVAIYNHFCDTTIGGIKNHGDEGVWDLGPTLTSSKSSHHLDMERTSQDLFKVDAVVKSEKVDKPLRWMPDAVRKYHERRDSTDQVAVAGDSPEDYMSPIESRVIIEASTHRVHLLKSNTLTFDSTGSGRPLAAIAANIALYLKVPYVRVDCSQLVSSKWQDHCKNRSFDDSGNRKGALAQLMSGYVGETIWDMVPKLLKKADHDLDLAERGIVFLDNMDRVGLNSDSGDHPEGVKETLAEIFQFIDGTEVSAPGLPPVMIPPDLLARSPSLESGIDVASVADCEENHVTIHTSHLFFICFGVNDKVENERRRDSIASKGSMGTSRSSSSGRGTHSGDSDERREPRSFSTKKQGDFADSGSFYTDDEDDESFEALHDNNMMHLLREVKNIPINHFQKLLGMNDVELTMTPEAMEVIVAQAQLQNAGGDGIRTILEKLLFEVKFVLQTEMQDKIIKAVEITEEAVLGKAPPNFLENVQSTNSRKESSGSRQISQISLNTIYEESNGTELRAKVSTRTLMKAAFMNEYEEDVFRGLEL